MQIAMWYHSSKDTATKLASTIEKDFNIKVRIYPVRVEIYSEVEAAVAEVVKDFGRLDVMIANAGIPSKAGGLDSTVAEWDRVRNVDLDVLTLHPIPLGHC
jgi:sorbose reductase